MFGLGISELLLIFGIVVFLFGSKKIPDLARGMGQAINEFKKAQSSEDENITEKNSKES